MNRKVICVGSGRCGTVTIAARIATTGAYSLHEGVRIPPNGQVPRGRQGLPHAIQASQWELQSLAKRVRDIYEDWALKVVRKRAERAQESGTYFEAAHYLTGHLENLLDKIPTMRVIHLWRPVDEVVESFIRKNEGRRGGNPTYATQGRHVKNYEAWEKWSDCFPLWKTCASQEEGYARYWNWANRRIEAFLEEHPEVQSMRLSMKELNSEVAWQAICDFCGVDYERLGEPKRHNARPEPLKGAGDPSMQVRIATAAEMYGTWRPNGSTRPEIRIPQFKNPRPPSSHRSG